MSKRNVGKTVGRVMREHEPYWNLGRCKCGARLGDSIDWNWHLANESARAALADQENRGVSDAD